MPIGARDNLQKLYETQHLLADEAKKLEMARDRLAENDSYESRYYILDIQIEALLQEFSRISSRISDVLERDLQR